jgi:menaquinone-dependent protoporphyrinogen oxidase
VRRDQLSRWGRILFRITGCRYGDYRAWPEIEAWAGEIGDQLAREVARPASSEPL